MKPLAVIKQLNKTIDLVQEEIEDCKKNNDLANFQLYLYALDHMKLCLHEALNFLHSMVPKEK